MKAKREHGVDHLLTLRDVAGLMAVSLRTVQRDVRARLLRPSYRRGRRKLCTEADIVAYRIRLANPGADVVAFPMGGAA